MPSVLQYPMKLLKAAMLTLLITATVMGCNSGGSPTAPPPPTINLAGSWEGFWNVQGEPNFLTMFLNQAPNTTTVDGTMTLVDVTFPIRGTTTFVTATTGSLDWEAVDLACGSFTGHFEVLSLSSLSGNAELSTIGCELPVVFTGRMDLTKVGNAAPVIESRTPGSNLEDIAREIAERP